MPEAGGLQPLGHANAQPTHVCMTRVGVEPTDHEGLSFAALPDCVPCRGGGSCQQSAISHQPSAVSQRNLTGPNLVDG